MMDYTRVSFGMHKGKKWSEVPEQYLKWIVREFDKKNPNRKTARRELGKRGGKRDNGTLPDYSHIIPDPSQLAPWEGESEFPDRGY